MVFPVIGGDGKPTGYEIENSCKFEPNAYVSRYDGVGDESSNAGKIGTVSLWTKRGDLGRAQGLFVVYEHNGQGYQTIWFNSDDTLQLAYEISGTEYQVKTNAKFRDHSAWYHVVAMTDTTQGTDSNRMKIYVNGTEQSYGSTAYPPQNTTLLWGKGDSTNYQYRIGNKRGVGSTTYAYYNGYIAEVHLCMGQNYTASEFGETNDNGVWIPKKADVSYGTNGGFYEFKQTGTSANASGIGADTSGTGNHATVGGLEAIDVTTDTPTNNFCTINPIDVGSGHTSLTISEGNTKVVKSSTESNPGDGDRVGTTMKFTKGKWYWEEKAVSGAATGGNGIYSDKLGGPAHWHDNYGYYFDPNGNESNSGSQIARRQENDEIGYGSSAMDDVSNNDIIMCALDLDNNRWYIGVNGQWSNNNAASGGTATANSAFNQSSLAGYFTIPSGGNGGFWGPFFGPAGSTTAKETQFNFGNPPFSISSSNADANGYGNFEYAVPSGYYSMCTKNLAEYG